MNGIILFLSETKHYVNDDTNTYSISVIVLTRLICMLIRLLLINNYNKLGIVMEYSNFDTVLTQYD